MDILLERIVDCIGPKHGAKKELAENLGIHPNVITNWLNGRNKSYRRYVNEISSFYGVSSDYLLGKTDKREVVPTPATSRDANAESNLPKDVKNMAAALALALRQQKKLEKPPLPELEEAKEILDQLDENKLNAALLMLRGLSGKQ